MEIKEDKESVLIHCGKNMDKETVLAQKKQLLQILSQVQPQKKSIIFQAKDLLRLDTAGIQLLVCFCLTLKKHGIVWQWMQVSSSLQEAARLLGSDKLLQLAKEPINTHG